MFLRKIRMNTVLILTHNNLEMSKLLVTFTFKGKKLYGYVDGYVTFLWMHYALIFVRGKEKAYLISIKKIIIIDYVG